MATSAPKPVPKAVPKAVAPPEAAEELPVVKKSRKKLILVLIAVLLLAGGGGGAAWYFIGDVPAAPAEPGAADEAKPEVKAEPAQPPVYVALDPFTVNLAQETGEQFLQAAVTIQVADQGQVDLIKLYMPLVRSRLLLLLSSKKASEISTLEGKKNLSTEITAQLATPFAANTEPQKISAVHFTAFVIQ